MKAVCWQGKHDVRVETVPQPRLLSPTDAILQVTAAAIGGTDLHLYDALLPGVQPGDILGHEFMGVVVEVGSQVSRLRAGDRVVVPAAIGCGVCWFCRQEQWGLCDNTHPSPRQAETVHGFAGAGRFGMGRRFGGFAGGQAEFVRLPFADRMAVEVPVGMADEALLLLAASFPAGWMAAESCAIRPGEVMAVFGCGAVGLLAIRSALLLGAERVIAVDLVAERLRLAETWGAEPLNIQDLANVAEELKRRTGGRGPDGIIDAVGLAAQNHSAAGVVDRARQKMHLESDHPGVLPLAIKACRKGGTIAIAGHYDGAGRLPIGAAYAKNLQLKFGLSHPQRYLRPLLQRIEQGEIDPAPILTHTFSLSQAPQGYRLFHRKEEGCIKVVLKP